MPVQTMHDFHKGLLLMGLVNRPVLMNPDDFERMVTFLRDMENYFPEDDEGTPLAVDESGVAVIPIKGTLIHKKMCYAERLGVATSYESIRERLNAALVDESIHEIVFDIDSPGGTASGAFDISDVIYNARGNKPMTAFVNDVATSGAYLIASSTDKVVVSQTSETGSIGVIMVHVDVTGYDEYLGFKFTAIKAGEKKAAFWPHEPLSEETRKDAQSEVDYLWDMFIASVARNRNLDEKAIRGMEAGIFTGGQAVKNGLADQVIRYDAPLWELVSRIHGTDSDNDAPGEPETRTEKPAPSIGSVHISHQHHDSEEPMDIKELKEKHPDLYAQVVAEGAEKAENSMSSKMTALEKGLEDAKKKNAELDKQLAVMSMKSAQAEAGVIFERLMAGSSIPKGFHAKVANQVSYTDFMKDAGLDADGYEKALTAEIKDWEDKMPKTKVQGFGSCVANDPDDEKKQADAKEDEDLSKEILEASGNKTT